MQVHSEFFSLLGTVHFRSLFDHFAMLDGKRKPVSAHGCLMSCKVVAMFEYIMLGYNYLRKCIYRSQNKGLVA